MDGDVDRVADRTRAAVAHDRMKRLVVRPAPTAHAHIEQRFEPVLEGRDGPAAIRVVAVPCTARA